MGDSCHVGICDSLKTITFRNLAKIIDDSALSIRVSERRHDRHRDTLGFPLRLFASLMNVDCAVSCAAIWRLTGGVDHDRELQEPGEVRAESDMATPLQSLRSFRYVA